MTKIRHGNESAQRRTRAMTERRGIYREYIQILPAAERGAPRPVVSADELGARLGSPPPAERAVETFVRVGAPEPAPKPAPEPAAPAPQPAAAASPAAIPVGPAAAPVPMVLAADRGAAIPAAGDAPLLPRRTWFADRMTLAAAAAALVLASATLAWQIAVRSHVETETAALQSSVSELKQRLTAREDRPTMPPSRYAERARPSAQADHTRSVSAPPAAAHPPAPQSAAAAVPLRPRIEPEAAPPAIAEDWVLREVFRGRALVEGRRGFFEVAVGTPLPGLGRVEAIEQRNGRMVVVTERGLIVAAY